MDNFNDDNNEERLAKIASRSSLSIINYPLAFLAFILFLIVT
jgi:hypothetical protein